MQTKSLNYQYLSKYFVTLPLLSILTICFTVYLLSNMVSSIKNEIGDIQNINRLLAESTTSENAHLITEQVQYISQSLPEIESIDFFATQIEQPQPNPTLSTYTIFFGTFYTIHEPIKLQSDDKQFIGYVNTSINLKRMRQSWFNRNLPMFAMVLCIFLLSLFIILKILKNKTKTLPLLEELSQKVLTDAEVDIQNYREHHHKDKNVWLYEQALLHLLKNQKNQQYNLEKLNEELIVTKDILEQYGEQYATFQSNLTHEFQLSLDDISTGLKLLQSQYISNEQKDAVEMICRGNDDLNIRLNELILLNRMEKGQTVVTLSQFNPSNLLNRIVEKFANQAHEKNLILLARTYHADYILEGDVQKLELILSSLVENALKFTEIGEVTICSQIQHLENNIRWTVQVTDTGIGIDKKHFQNIFQPFFQIDPTIRHSKSPMTVGLFLANKIAQSLDAEIDVTSELYKGSVFRLQVVLKDWNNHTDQQILQDKKIAIWYKNEYIINHAQRLINTGMDIQRFNDSELLLDYVTHHSVDLLIITFKIPIPDVIALTKKLREIEINRPFRTLVLYYYNPNYLSPKQTNLLKSAGVDYLENAKADISLKEHFKQIMQYLN